MTGNETVTVEKLRAFRAVFTQFALTPPHCIGQYPCRVRGIGEVSRRLHLAQHHGGALRSSPRQRVFQQHPVVPCRNFAGGLPAGLLCLVAGIWLAFGCEEMMRVAFSIPWRRIDRAAEESARVVLSPQDFVWAMGSFCALHRKAFDPALLLQQFPAPHTLDALIHAARALGFRIRRRNWTASDMETLPLPCLVLLRPGEAPEGPQAQSADGAETAGGSRLAIVHRADASGISLFPAGGNVPTVYSREDFAKRYAGIAYLISPEPPAVNDPDAVAQAQRAFGFRWFVPELLRHRRIWRDVLIASLVIQVLV